MFGDGRYLTRRRTLKELITRVWSQKNSSLPIIFEATLPDNEFDFIVAGQPQWQDKLQAEIDQRYHLVELVENRGSNEVVVVKNAPVPEAADIREAQVKLAELRSDNPENSLPIQRVLARIKELERMQKEEPNASAALREAEASLAELRVDYPDQNPIIQKTLAKIKILQEQQNSP